MAYKLHPSKIKVTYPNDSISFICAQFAKEKTDEKTAL